MKKKNTSYTEGFKEFILNAISKNRNITHASKEACVEFNIPYDDTVRRNVSYMLKSSGVTDSSEKPIEESDDFKKAKEREFDKSKNRFIITWCQNETDIHEQFLSNIEKYAQVIDASIHVILGRYRNPSSLSTSKDMEKREEDIETFWDKRVIPYADANRHNIHKHLCILSDIKVQPTASNPLSGLNGITGLESCVLGHPRVHLKSLPILDGYPHKLLLTTGAVSVENYTDTKVGAKGAFHHTLGFAIVELDGDNFHVRQVTASEDGSFYDLDLFVDEEGVSYHSGADHIVFGDLHLGETNEEVLEASFEMAKKLQCKDIILHDVFNGHSISHHERNNPFLLLKREEDGSDNLFKELDSVLDFFNEYHEYNFTVIKSNHDVFLDRWLNDVDWRKSNNKMAYLKLANLLADSKGDKGVLELYLKECGIENAFCLGLNDSYVVGGIECGQHGHIGANGSRGGSNQFKELNTRIITGHCLPGEYLVQTKDKGWKEIRSVKVGDEILSWDWVSNDNVWNKVNEFIEYDYDGIMFQIRGNGFEQTFTSNHHLMLSNGDYIPASQAVCGRSASELPLSANPVDDGGISVPEDIIRRIVAIAADGSVDKYRVRFHFKKQRKVNRIKELFGSDLVCYSDSEDNFDAKVSIDSELIKEIERYKPLFKMNKHLGKEILSWDRKSLEILEEELMFWDGTFEPKGNARQYSTSNKYEANMVSSILNRLGYSNTTTVKKRDFNDKHSSMFIITWCKNRDYIKNSQKLNHESRFNGWGFNTYQSKSKTYCVSVDNKCFWVKSGKTGQVSLTGNSHSPIRVDGHSAVGTLTHLRVGYNSGASSWMNTNIAVYPNGKYQHINIINNKYTTL